MNGPDYPVCRPASSEPCANSGAVRDGAGRQAARFRHRRHRLFGLGIQVKSKRRITLARVAAPLIRTFAPALPPGNRARPARPARPDRARPGRIGRHRTARGCTGLHGAARGGTAPGATGWIGRDRATPQARGPAEHLTWRIAGPWRTFSTLHRKSPSRQLPRLKDAARAGHLWGRWPMAEPPRRPTLGLPWPKVWGLPWGPVSRRACHRPSSPGPWQAASGRRAS